MGGRIQYTAAFFPACRAGVRLLSPAATISKTHQQPNRSAPEVRFPMLKVMRNSFQQLKWILIAIVASFILFIFVDWGAGGAGGGRGPDTSFAARVNGQTVSLRQYERGLYYAQKNYEQMYRQNITEEMLDAMGLKKQVLDSLVDETLMLQQADKLHLGATTEEIRKRILELPMFNPDGKFIGPDLYARYVTGALGFATPAEFEEEIGREITRQKMESAFVNSVVVSPKAAEDEYRRISENAKIRYVLFPANRVISTVSVTPAEVDAQYKANVSRYTHSEQRDVKYLIADFAVLRAQINPADAEIRKRYDASKEDYKTGEQMHAQHILLKLAPNATPAENAAAKAKAGALVAKLRGGPDFAALAKTSSDDPGSATRGGDLGFFSREQMVKEFADAAFSLPIGQISDPVKSQFGYHILRVLEKRPAGYKPFEEVKDQIRGTVVDQMAKDQAREEITRLSVQIQQKKPRTPEEFAAFANARVISNDTQWFGKSDSIAGIGYNPAVTSWAFGAKQGDIGGIIGTKRGPVIPYLFAIRPAGVSPLSEVRDRVEQDTRVAKARDMARAALSREMSAGTPDAIAAKLGLTAAETTINRSGQGSGLTGDVQPLVEAALSARVGEVKGPIEVGDGAIVFQVQEQNKVDQKKFEENRNAYITSLRQREAQTLRTVLMDRLRKESKIVINNELIAPKAANQRPTGV
jgi:peptidyl-prolyl cis-trans isomerase D